MTARVDTNRPDFGFDVPSFVPLSGLVGVAGLVIAGAGAFAGWWGLVALGLVVMLAGIASVVLVLRSARSGMVALRERILDGLGMRGDEHTLDLAPSRGVMLVGLASRLDTGTATGVDPWHPDEDGGSVRDAAARNARVCGVGERVHLVEGELVALPFEDEVFDVVTAWLPSRSLRTPDTRLLAVAEAVRVLRPGGKLVFVDFRGTTQYAEVARQAELVGVTLSPVDWTVYPPVKVVTASKPAAVTVPDDAGAADERQAHG